MRVNGVFLGGVDHTPAYVRSAHVHDFTYGGGVISTGRSNCHKQNGLCGRNRYSDN